MILVLLGTQANDFSRLLEKLEKCIENNIITDSVVVQSGFTKFVSIKFQNQYSRMNAWCRMSKLRDFL